MKPNITIDDFAKLDIRVGTIVEATVPKGSNKLIRQVVDFGPVVGERIIFSGILECHQPEDLIGKQLPYVLNLEPRKMMGEESQGMLLAAAPVIEEQTTAVLLELVDAVPNGTSVI